MNTGKKEVINFESTHYISHKLNETLKLLSLVEERSMYVLIKELKKNYNRIIYWNADDEKVDFEQEYFDSDEMAGKIYKFSIPAYDVKQAFIKAKIDFKTTIELFEKLPNRLKIYNPNGEIDIIWLFRRIKYDPNYNEFVIWVNEEFYDYVKLQNNDMDRWFKIYHNEFFRISGKHTRNMYRLACMWENKSIELKIDTVKKFFLYDGSEEVPAKKFFSNIIERSITELHSKTKIKIKYEKIKQGREIYKIKFIFSRPKKEDN